MTASKTKRLLYFMSELEKGNDISKTDYLARFGISERTLKEDVSELKDNLTELRPNMKVKYSKNMVPTMLSMNKVMVTLNTIRQLSYLRFF